MQRRREVLWAVCVMATGYGCASLSYSNTAGGAYAAKPATCELKIQNRLPDPSVYEEIGSVNGMSKTNDPLKYKKMIQAEVCRAGGDLVVGEVNGLGHYVRGTVFRKKD
jgi:hypothetical protein